MKHKKPISRLRVLQMVLGVLVVVSLFLPWFSDITHLQGGLQGGEQEKVVKSFTLGWRVNFAMLLLVIDVVSVVVSLIESWASRRARFYHVGCFVVTMIGGVAIYAMVMIHNNINPLRMSQSEVAWGFNIFLVSSLVLIAVSSMLSPSCAVGSHGENSEC